MDAVANEKGEIRLVNIHAGEITEMTADKIFLTAIGLLVCAQWREFGLYPLTFQSDVTG